MNISFRISWRLIVIVILIVQAYCLYKYVGIRHYKVGFIVIDKFITGSKYGNAHYYVIRKYDNGEIEEYQHYNIGGTNDYYSFEVGKRYLENESELVWLNDKKVK